MKKKFSVDGESWGIMGLFGSLIEMSGHPPEPVVEDGPYFFVLELFEQMIKDRHFDLAAVCRRDLGEEIAVFHEIDQRADAAVWFVSTV